MTCHLFLQCLLFGTMSHFKTLPKFAQIPAWWRHTGSSVDFLITGPIFLNSAIFFTLEMVQLYFLGQKVLFFYITFYLRSKCRNTPIFTHLAPMTSQIWESVNSKIYKGRKYPNFKRGELRQKLIFFDAVFFVRSEIESTMQLSNKNRGLSLVTVSL